MKIKELRQKLKLSQYEVANKLGMPQTTFHYYEVGRNEPNIETLIKIADFFISASPLLAALILLRKQFFNNYKCDEVFADLLFDILLDDDYDGSDAQIGAAYYISKLDKSVLKMKKEKLLQAQKKMMYFGKDLFLKMII